MLKIKTISIILCFSIVFSMVFFENTPKANAAWPTLASIMNLIPEALGAAGSWATLGTQIASTVKTTVGQIIITASKIAALLAVQKATQLLIGDGGGSGVITDWNNYLYVSPQQTAIAQMNSFFTTVSQGRLSSLNYEGVGPNYDAYLVGQAQQAIAGQTFQTNLQQQVTDPSQLLSGGNTKGLMTYMQCANNVACYTLTATAQYNTQLAKAQDIAKNEQSNGFLPQKKNGIIVQPASVVAGALTAIDQLGTQLIMSTTDDSGVASGEAQIAAGASISIIARGLNYSTASTQGKQAIANKNSQFPFSLSYSSANGVGVK